MIPRIENLRQLELLCEADPDREFWQTIVWAMAWINGDMPLNPEFHDWRVAWLALGAYRRTLFDLLSHPRDGPPDAMQRIELSQQFLIDEFNLYLTSLFKDLSQ